jgi:hypothetical protein
MKSTNKKIELTSNNLLTIHKEVHGSHKPSEVSSPGITEGTLSLITAMREALKKSQIHKTEETRTRLQSLSQNIPNPRNNHSKTLSVGSGKENQAGTNHIHTKKQDLERGR